MNTPLTNANRHARVDVADVLRGFAVMAIILLHSIEHFNFYSFPDTYGQPAWLNFTDKAIWNGLFFAFGSKAYGIFALLFGFSFFIQDDNQRMRGRDFRLRFCWRLLCLFIIGQFDAIFFTGEILVLYALVGFVLVLTCRLSTRLLVIIGTLLILQPICIYQMIRAGLDPAYEILKIESGPYWGATYAAQSGGSFLDIVKVNLWEGQLASLAWAWEHGRLLQTAALFIFGMLIGRSGWFGREYLSKWGKILAAAILLYFPLTGIINLVPAYVENPNFLTPFEIFAGSIANLCLMLMWVAGILFAYYHTTTLSAKLALLIPYGRMSMTNYVTQGIIGSALYYNWGLHLQMGITGSLLIGIAIFLVQWGACRWWFKTHTHGPLEYVWKKATWIW
ncbi:MAG: DUF418 domain-containing protein [Muribaculaceae bacterium]|nr:DUF418 domain-containing protein [Muribaculaceae bacterium]